MTIQRQGDGPHWDVHLDGNTLVVGGLRLDLDTQQGATAIYALPDGSPTLERTDWLGALVEVPAYIGMESVVEIVNENGGGREHYCPSAVGEPAYCAG